MTRSDRTRRQFLVALGATASAGCLGERDGGTETTPPVEGRGTEAIVPETTVESLDTPVGGNPDADVTVTAYEDFACPHCRDYSLDVVPKLFEEFAAPGKIRYERRDFPLPVDETWSWAAANAARAVQATVGVDAFWEYVDLLYENQDRYSYDRVAELAGQVDADGETVRTAARAGVYRPVIQADRERGRNRGVTGTPTVFVNDRHVDQSYEKLREAIRSELDSSG